MDNNLIDLSFNAQPSSEIVIELGNIQIKNIKELIHTSDTLINNLFNDPENLLLNMDKVERINIDVKHAISLLSTMDLKSDDKEKKQITENLAKLLLKTNVLKNVHSENIKQPKVKINTNNIFNHDKFLDIKSDVNYIKENTTLATCFSISNFVMIFGLGCTIIALIIFYNINYI